MSAFLITLLKAFLAVCMFGVVLVLVILILGYTIYKICGYDQPPADGSLGFDAADEDAEYDAADWPASDHAGPIFSSEPEPPATTRINGHRVFADAKPDQPCAD